MLDLATWRGRRIELVNSGVNAGPSPRRPPQACLGEITMRRIVPFAAAVRLGQLRVLRQSRLARSLAVLIAAAALALVPVAAFGATCGASAMYVVAHEDDDLLFLSPDLLHDIQSGACVTTVFVTA